MIHISGSEDLRRRAATIARAFSFVGEGAKLSSCQNRPHDHIPFIVKGNGNIVFAVCAYLVKLSPCVEKIEIRLLRAISTCNVLHMVKACLPQ